MLWTVLRAGKLGGLKFRRQHAIGPFVVDFYCPAAGLTVEIDGISHVDRATDDAKRTAYVKRRGVKVIRFTNDEILHDLDIVAEAIARAAGVDV